MDDGVSKAKDRGFTVDKGSELSDVYRRRPAIANLYGVRVVKVTRCEYSVGRHSSSNYESKFSS